MSALAVFHLVAGTTLTGLAAHAWVNHLTWPRLASMPPAPSPIRVSVLIPARNEAERIGGCVGRWATQEYPEYEVLVYDDDSSDDTAARVLEAAAGARHVRLIRGGSIPDGWRGKPHACHRLRALARGRILVFADADVLPAPDGLARVVGAFGALSVDALSAVPAHTSRSWAVQALVALQNWAAITFVPAWLTGRTRCPWLAAMNGQFIAIRADTYDASGGFAAVRLALAEDVALGRRLRALGYRLRLLDGAGVLGGEPYREVRALWRANVRNLLPVLFGSVTLLLLCLLALIALYLIPPALLVIGVASGRGGSIGWTWAPLAELAIGLVPRLLADRRARYPARLALLHPWAIAMLVAMGVASIARFRVRRVVEWRGRSYRVTGTAA
jgi:cellulose synthase/poly-beta-1,6-N-acetylglucosamine synthase-like glycosyltransferase